MSPPQPPPQPDWEGWQPSQQIVEASRHIYELYSAYYKAQHEDALIDIQIADELYEQATGKPFDHEARGRPERRKTNEQRPPRRLEEVLADLNAPLSEAEAARHRDAEHWYQFFEQALQTERQHLPGLELRRQAYAEEKELGRLLAQDPPPTLTELLGPVPRPGGRYRVDVLTGERLSLRDYWFHAAGAVWALRFSGGIDVNGEPLKSGQEARDVSAHWPQITNAGWTEDVTGARVHVEDVMKLVTSVRAEQSLRGDLQQNAGETGTQYLN